MISQAWCRCYPGLMSGTSLTTASYCCDTNAFLSRKIPSAVSAFGCALTHVGCIAHVAEWREGSLRSPPHQRSHLVLTLRWAAVALRSAATISCIAIHMCMFGHPKPCWEGRMFLCNCPGVIMRSRGSTCLMYSWRGGGVDNNPLLGLKINPV